MESSQEDNMGALVHEGSAVVDDAPDVQQVEESVVLLARAKWYLDWSKTHEEKKDLYKYPVFRSTAAAENELPPEAVASQEWAEDAMYKYFEDEFDDDDVEAYYFSAQAGTSRITLGNRRWGQNGYVRSGHRCARPTGGNAPRPSKNSGKPGASACPPSKGTSSAAGSASSSGNCKGQGRRARRNARRNAVDACRGD